MNEELIDLTAPENRPNPYPIYAKIREARIMKINPGGFWAVGRYADVIEVLGNHEGFSSKGFRPLFEPAWVGENPLAHSLVTMDGEEHAEIRAIVVEFLQRAIKSENFRQNIKAHAERLADRLAHTGEIEFMSEFATPLQTRVLSKTLGLDPEWERKYKAWTSTMVQVTPNKPNEARAQEMIGHIQDMKAHVMAVIEQRAAEPADDLISSLVDARVPPQKILAVCSLVMASNMEPPGYLMSNSIRYLSDHPEMYQTLQADRSLIPKFIVEMLRWDSPVPGVPRMATRDTELLGVDMPKGTCVYACFGAANRDPQEFKNPDTFDLHRTYERGAFGHVDFGFGVHHCPGHVVGRTEVQFAIESLLDRFSGFSVDKSRVKWNGALTGRGTTVLPVVAHA